MNKVALGGVLIFAGAFLLAEYRAIGIALMVCGLLMIAVGASERFLGR